MFRHAVACLLALINSLIWVKYSTPWGDTRGWCWVLRAFRAEWTHHSWFANQNHKSKTHRSRMRKQAFNPVSRAPLDRKKKREKKVSRHSKSGKPIITGVWLSKECYSVVVLQW